MSEEISVEIDQYNLDKEWLGQPKKMKEAVEEWSEAKDELAQAKAKLDRTKAKLELDIRKNPDKFDLGKVTEAIVAAAVLLELDYKKALNDVNEAQYRVNTTHGTVDALDHRKRALENLVRLFGMDYFSSPQAKTEQDREAMGTVEKRSARRRAIRGDKK